MKERVKKFLKDHEEAIIVGYWSAIAIVVTGGLAYAKGVSDNTVTNVAAHTDDDLTCIHVSNKFGVTTFWAWKDPEK